jgi:hypothetical protein
VLVSRKLLVAASDGAVDLVGADVDLERPYSLRVRVLASASGAGDVYLGDVDLVAPDGYLYNSPSSVEPETMHMQGQRPYVAVSGNNATICVLAWSE